MDFPDYFADANSGFNEAEFVIFGVPYDKTSSFRYGSKYAPNKIRQSSWNFETFNIKNCISKHESFPDMFEKPIYWY